MDRWQPTYPQDLYHYTSANGLVGMLQDNRLWATNASYLNDFSELLYAQELAYKILDDHRSYGNGPALEAFLTEAMKEVKNPSYDVYVVCFCAKKDQLSQWRAYGNAVSSFCLSFRFTQSALNVAHPRSVIRKVLYKREDQVDLLSQMVDRFCETLLAYEHESELSDESEATAKMLASLFRENFGECFFWLKNPAFAEEDEWRIALLHPRKTFIESRIAPPLYRVQEGQVVPYRELALTVDNGGRKRRLPLTGVRIGPSRHPELSVDAVTRLVTSVGFSLNDVDISTTEATLRV